MPDNTAPPVSRLYTEDGQTFLKVTAEHAISADWLQANAPELYRLWRGAIEPADRDALARHIEDRFAYLEDSITPHDAAAEALADRYPKVGSIGLYALIDDYEASLIAHPDHPRGSTAQFAVLAGYISENHLQAHSLVADLKLRDWAERNTPTWLTAWQRKVLAAADYNAGDPQMQAMRAAHRWAGALSELSAELANLRDLPALSAALDRALDAGYPIAENLPRLAAAASGATGRPSRELHYELVAECETALPPMPTGVQIGEAMAASPNRRIPTSRAGHGLSTARERARTEAGHGPVTTPSTQGNAS